MQNTAQIWHLQINTAILANMFFYQGRVSTGNKNILLTVTNTVFKRHFEYKRKFFTDSSLKKDTA